MQRRAEFAQTIVSNTQRMQRIVDELLDLSRIESGHWRPNPQRVRLADVATEIFARVGAPARSKGVSLTTNIGSGSETVYADRTALEQILLNLVENALRYTGGGGQITIQTQHAEHGTALMVKDTGSGIPPEHLPRIFERFYRADAGRSRESGGTGLGLAIAKHIVLAHDGSIWAHSELNHGSTFSFTLPVGSAT